jgi:acyl transferase domain-containing protein/NAD(P)H-dependent flavin oxidoreductase YrpB (nitropropane dioxygenase family)
MLDLTAGWNAAAYEAFVNLSKHAMGGSVGLRCLSGQIPPLADLQKLLPGAASSDAERLIIFTAGAAAFDPEILRREIELAQAAGWKTLVEAINLAEARMAQSCGATAVIAKGHEGAGRVGDITTFVLVQQFVRELTVPVFAQGGIGLHSAAAVAAAGVTGLVLDSQLYLCRDSGVSPQDRLRLERMDGSETTLLSGPQGQTFRVVGAGSTWADVENLQNGVWPADYLLVGQDACFARLLAQVGGTVSGALQAMHQAVVEQIAAAARAGALSEDSPLAKSHGTRYPIIQGAMTRVSDTSEFAAKVAEGGALPFLALSLMRGPEIEKLLEATSERLGKLPWGVGLLGFVPQALRQEQLAVVDRFKPPFAMIAGGRPDQAKALEDDGTPTYLHVPSPLLLKSFIEMGSRRFIFEGKECGGHVGPRSSFILWQSMVEVLLDCVGPRDDVSGYHIIFAGGIHDALSAAMVAALAAPLSARGIKCGFLVGTAYLFTEEAVSSGAIVEKFQQAAIACEETVLLETGPGHSIRCIDSPYKETFSAQRQKLEQEEKSPGDIREELELLNLGRLRIASKGLTKDHTTGGGGELVNIPAEQQWQEGMYMIGQVAAMHDAVTTIADLHHDLSAGGQSLLTARNIEQALEQPLPEKPSEPIAIVGISCQFPQSNDVETYWRNILEKVDSIGEVPPTHFNWQNYYDADPMARDKIISKWGGFLSDVVFDPSAYGIPPSSLDSIDPMQVLILEAARSALADAGYGKRKYTRAKTSVILANAGHGPITALYSLRSMLGWKLQHLSEDVAEQIKSEIPEWTEDSFAGYLGNVAAGRVANRLDLKGINFSIDAACASSLAALYVSIADLRSGASDVVLLGATDTHNQPGDYLSFSKTYALSPTGRCKTFDAKADGIAISEGIAMLVLKRLSDAERDGDRIYAVIRGIGGSSDGRDLSLTAPRPAGQMLALERAYADAGCSPASVQLVEAHGTGTVAGDKAEVEALTRVFQAEGAKPGSCAIGSVKTNIGHTKAAAGLASIVKIAKALHHKVLPPTINVSEPNPACNFDEGPFYINSQCRPWLKGQGGAPRRGSVSAFGFGGTNFHTVLEEYIAPCEPAASPTLEAWPAELFVWKSASGDDLLKALAQMESSIKKLRADYVLESSDTSQARRRLFDLAAKLHLKNNDGRPAPTGLAIVASSIDELESKIAEAKTLISAGSSRSSVMPRGIHFVANGQSSGSPQAARPKVAFLFPGQGSQKVGMLQELSLYFPDIRLAIENGEQILQSECNLPNLSRYIYPPPAFSQSSVDKLHAALTATNIAQPAIGVCDLAMLGLLNSFGVKADMTAGHSYGEYVALHAAGVFTANQLLQLSAERGRILGECAENHPGAMAAVSTNSATIRQLLETLPGVSLANINSPSQCIISGDVPAIEAAITALQAKQIACKRISVSAAFHSPLMNDSRAQLAKVLKTITCMAPQVPVFSNTTARPYEGAGDVIAAQLAEHALKPVLFADELEAMHDSGARIFVEVGPGNILTGLADATLKGRDFVAVNLERQGKNSLEHFLSVLGLLSVSGVAIDLGKLYWNRLFSSREKMEPAIASPGKKLLYRVNSAKIERIGAGGTAKVLKPAARTSAAPQNSVPAPAPKTATGAPGLAPVAAQSHLQPSTNKPAVALPGRTSAPHQVAAQTAAGAHTAAGAQTVNKSKAAQVIQNAPVNKVSPLSGNGNGKYPASDQFNKNPNGQQSMASNNKNGIRPSSGRPDRDVDRVMLEFQQTMLEMTNRFLETQQSVMMAYLQAKQGGLPQIPGFDPALMQSGDQSQVQSQAAAQAQALAQLLQASQQSIPQMMTQQYAIPVDGEAAEFASQSGLQPASSNGANGYATNGDSAAAQGTAAAAATGGAGADLVTADSLVESLYEIVSERTGYPREMLNPDLDLEADMGIDSIKRVEILNNFRKLLPEATQAKLESGIEALAGTKTLQGIIDWIRSLDDLGGESAPAASNHENNGTEPAGAGKTPAAQSAANSNGAAGGAIGLRQAPAAGPSVAKNLVTSDSLPGNIENVARGVVVLEELPAPGITFKALASVTVIIGDNLELAKHVASGIEARGGKSIVLQASQVLSSEKTIEEALASVRATYGSVGSIINLCQPAEESDSKASTWSRLTGTFLLAKAVQKDLVANAGAGFRAGFVNATYLGGDFGGNIVDGVEPLSQVAEQAGIVGLTKTIAKEMPGVYVKVVDLSKSVAAVDVAKIVVAELLAADDIVEVGLYEGQRVGLQVEDASYAKLPLVEKPVLDKSSVVLVTGGARGITARIIAELARKYQPTFVIAGRLPKPKDAESPTTAGLTVPKDIKAQIIEERKNKGLVISVREVERAFQQLMREREVRTNLEELKALGATVKYYAVDVTDPVAFGQLIGNIYETSTIDGIIHGAGVIEDALIKDKTVDSFQRVFNTKVQSAITLAKHVNFDTLKFMFFFSSVVGRTGNSGQADYVSANEAVNKLALVLQQRTKARIASLMWGPWQAGMAPPELEEVFASHGWSMIQPEDGRDCFHEELLRDCHEQVEVLLVGRLTKKDGGKPVNAEGMPKTQTVEAANSAVASSSQQGALVAGAAAAQSNSNGKNGNGTAPHIGTVHVHGVKPEPSGVILNQAVLQSHDSSDLEETHSYFLTIDTKQHLYLDDHKFDGIPVMPMAVALEMMLEAARSVFPNDHILRVSELDIPAGIVFQAAQKDFIVDVQIDPLAEKTVAVQLTSANPKKVHFRCKVAFSAQVLTAPPVVTTALTNKVDRELDMSLLVSPPEDLPQPQDVYGKWLFHGPLFQGISSVLVLGEQTVLGTVSGCEPIKCVTTADGSDWVVDPVLFDSSMQLAGIWARHFQDVTVLPTGFKALHVYGTVGLGKSTARIFLDEANASNLLCDLAIYDDKGHLAILVEGLGGIASKAFNRFSASAQVPEIAR